MQKHELPRVRARVSLLAGQPLTWLGYAADMLTLGFGVQGDFRLHIQCSYRMASEEAILFDRIDYFVPGDALMARWRAEGLVEEDFPGEWDDHDCRLFERVKALQSRLPEMRVEAVDVTLLGDLTLRFTGGLTLLVLPMASDGQECWRFWNDALWPEEHMVVCGDHVE
ncbi:MAG: hypothetical protein IJE07_06580 [Clostridia bacterium]|nr:hypothetical protein [Clostridia bacterium]